MRARAAALPPHDPSNPFHSALVEEIDWDLDLFDRGAATFHEPLEVLAVIRDGAELTGVVANDQAFARQANPGPKPVPLKHLYAQQPAYHHTVENQVRTYTRSEQLLPWDALEKEIAEGFGEVHLSLPPVDPARPDMFVKRFPIA